MGIENSNSDTYLVNNIKKRDTDAFRQFVEKYKDVSLSLACSIVKDKAEAEDVLQDAFIKVFEKIETFRFESTLSSWLYRIVVNTSYNALKKQKNHPSYSEIYVKANAPVNNLGFDLLKEDDQKKFIQIALEKMRPDEALIVRLFYLLELKIIEIQVITGFSSSKIRVDLHRGRANLEYELRKTLGKETHDLL